VSNLMTILSATDSLEALPSADPQDMTLNMPTRPPVRRARSANGL
jgi:hypothetical protein